MQPESEGVGSKLAFNLVAEGYKQVQIYNLLHSPFFAELCNQDREMLQVAKPADELRRQRLRSMFEADSDGYFSSEQRALLLAARLLADGAPQ